MHYCIVVITKDFPTNEVLNKKLAPYDSKDFYTEDDEEAYKTKKYPQFLWDYWKVGGRYGGMLKLKINEDDPYYKWRIWTSQYKAGTLFRSALLENSAKDWEEQHPYSFPEDEYLPYLGYYEEGHIKVDGCRVKDVIDFHELIPNYSWGFIGKDGESYSRDYYDGEHFIADEHYNEKVASAIKNVDDCYVTYIDIHE